MIINSSGFAKKTNNFSYNNYYKNETIPVPAK
jgi:hypothetical protein